MDYVSDVNAVGFCFVHEIILAVKWLIYHGKSVVV